MAKRVIVFVCAAMVVVTLTCTRTRTPELKQRKVLQIEQVVAEPDRYAGQIITVHGCYTIGFERSTVQPCINPKIEQLTWVEDAAVIESISKLKRPTLPDATPIELRTEIKPPLLFKYDEARNRKAWDRLKPKTVPRGLDRVTLEVTLVGQFENAADADAMPRFGHLNAFQHQLVLIDVLSAKQLNP